MNADDPNVMEVGPALFSVPQVTARTMFAFVSSHVELCPSYETKSSRVWFGVASGLVLGALKTA